MLITMEAWIIWIIVAVLLVGVEVLTQMVWTLCLAIGCLFAIVASLLGLDLAWQAGLAGAAAIVAYFALTPLLRKWQKRVHARDAHAVRTGMDALLGRRAAVVEEIRPGETGRVKIDGDNWQAVAPSAQSALMPGETVVVEGYDSIILTVEKA